MACWGLSSHWTLNPQYQYGWFVPALALYAGYARWQTRPAPGEPIPQALWVVVLASAPLPFVWLFLQPNPDWPLVNWFFVTQVVVITLATIGCLGGWKWVRHFFFPSALLLAAVPWPDKLESPVMQGLMRLAASIGVAVLDLIGIGAIQHGNVIEVASGVVGVDEACSGIRSLQGSLMAAVFLGEFFRFNLLRRLWLVVISLVCAFATNIFRVCFLAITAAHQGANSVDRWHDPAGLTTLGICVATILFVAFFLDRKSAPIRIPASVPVAQPLPQWLAPTLCVLLVGALLGTELWYRDSSPAPTGEWRVKLPAGSQSVPMGPSAVSQLRYDRALGATWTEPDSTRWLLYFFDWDYGPAFARVAAQTHNPGVCLPAGGRELQKERGEVAFDVRGEIMPFHAYIFNEGGAPLHVYHGVWQTRSERGMRHGELSRSKHVASLQTVLWRERYMTQQAAEVAVWGCASESEADAAFRKILPRLFQPRHTNPL